MYKKTFITLTIILSLSMAGQGLCGTKFINKDTAKDRKPIKIGTNSDKNKIKIKSDKNSNIMSTRPKDKEETPEYDGPIFVTPEIKIEKD